MWVKSSSDRLVVTIYWEVTLFVSIGGSLIECHSMSVLHIHEP